MCQPMILEYLKISTVQDERANAMNRYEARLGNSKNKLVQINNNSLEFNV